MNKRIICLVALFALFSSSFADSLLMRGSKPLSNLKDKIFLQGEEFIGLFQNELLNDETKPNQIYVFDVNIKNKDLIQNPKKLMKEVSAHQNLKSYFWDSSKTYASSYIQNAFSSEFNEKFIEAAENRNFNVHKVNFMDFDFTKNHNVIELVSVEWKDLKTLDKLVQKYQHKFESASKNNCVVMLKFSDKSHESVEEDLSAISFAQINSRMLSDETSTTTATTTTIPITAPGLAAYVISIALIIFTYMGSVILNDIKTPSRFYNKQFVVGEVQL